MCSSVLLLQFAVYEATIGSFWHDISWSTPQECSQSAWCTMLPAPLKLPDGTVFFLVQYSNRFEALILWWIKNSPTCFQSVATCWCMCIIFQPYFVLVLFCKLVLTLQMCKHANPYYLEKLLNVTTQFHKRVELNGLWCTVMGELKNPMMDNGAVIRY